MDREEMIMDAIKEAIPEYVVGAKAEYAVRKMRRVITVVFDVGLPTRQEFRVTVEDVT